MISANELRIGNYIHYNDMNLRVTEKCYGVMSIHHAKGRNGSLLTDKRYFKPLCRAHHNWVHKNTKKAIEIGLSFPV